MITKNNLSMGSTLTKVDTPLRYPLLRLLFLFCFVFCFLFCFCLCFLLFCCCCCCCCLSCFVSFVYVLFFNEIKLMLIYAQHQIERLFYIVK